MSFRGSGPLLGQLVMEGMERSRSRRQQAERIASILATSESEAVYAALEGGQRVLRDGDTYWICQPVEREELVTELLRRGLV
jgi:hypothetical protein